MRLYQSKLSSRRNRRRHRTLRRLGIGLGLLVVVLSPVIYSYVTAMTKPSSLPLGIRTVEWIRANGGAGLVSFVEREYYTWTAPSKGGPPLRALPAINGARGQTDPKPRSTKDPSVPRPPRIQLPIRPHLRGEGIWHPTADWVSGTPPVMVAEFRPDPSYPRVVAYVAWMNTKRVQLALYPGRYEPPSSLPRGPMMVPYDQRWRLLATFNSGFTYGDGHGGFYTDGHLYTPLVPGKATLLAYRNGQIRIAPWQGGARPGASVVLARQNASMIVQNGRLAPNLFNGNQSEWGLTLGNAILVWRSAVGVDKHGNLIYGAADYRTVGSLAKMMLEAGAVQAMNRTIATYWQAAAAQT